MKTTTPDTKIYMAHNDTFAGYHWMDGVTGNQGVSNYAGKNVDDELPQLCEWLSGMIGQGFYLTAREVYEADRDQFEIDEMRDDPRYDETGEMHVSGVGTMQVICMTPREMLEDIINLANEQAEQDN